jgi:hypothetical protein
MEVRLSIQYDPETFGAAHAAEPRIPSSITHPEPDASQNQN